jgi:hypothetical protein
MYAVISNYEYYNGLVSNSVCIKWLCCLLVHCAETAVGYNPQSNNFILKRHKINFYF